jgi:hypothetical protein
VTWLAILEVLGGDSSRFVKQILVMKFDIMHIVLSIRANPLKDGVANPPV